MEQTNLKKPSTQRVNIFFLYWWWVAESAVLSSRIQIAEVSTSDSQERTVQHVIAAQFYLIDVSLTVYRSLSLSLCTVAEP